MNGIDKKEQIKRNDIKAINGFADFMNGIWGNNNITKIEISQEYKENDKYTIHLTDEQYRKVIDAAQKDAKKEIIDKIEKYIRSNEWAEDYEKSSCRTKILRILEEE